MADNNIKDNLDDAAEHTVEAAKASGRATKASAKAAADATKDAAENVADVAEDVAEEAAKVFKKPTILNDLGVITSTTARLTTVVGFGTLGLFTGVLLGARVVDLADRVIAKRKA
jgi:hypothetical protein